MVTPSDILDFWFGVPGSPERETYRKEWFVKSDDFDDEIRGRFLDAYESAAAGEFEDWKTNPEGCLALLILLDQFPRNMFRGDARTYATDAMAKLGAEHALTLGFDQGFTAVECWFLYIPFEHSEQVEDQYRAVALFDSLPDDDANREAKKSAHRHLEIIQRFGRFPHRNPILDRETTKAEFEFLKEPHSSF